MSENSIEFSLSNSEQRDSWLNSGHRTLDADKITNISETAAIDASVLGSEEAFFITLRMSPERP